MSFEFKPVEGKKVVVKFDGGMLTTDAAKGRDRGIGSGPMIGPADSPASLAVVYHPVEAFGYSNNSLPLSKRLH